jgi:hypothetical protein
MTPEEIKKRVMEVFNDWMNMRLRTPNPMPSTVQEREKIVDLTIRLMQKNCISIEKHNKVIDKTKELMQEEQENKDYIMCNDCFMKAIETSIDVKKSLEKLIQDARDEERQKLKAELPEKLDKVVDEEINDYYELSKDTNRVFIADVITDLEKLKQKLREAVK